MLKYIIFFCLLTIAVGEIPVIGTEIRRHMSDVYSLLQREITPVTVTQG